ncbi:MAG: cytidylate kinase-like family protein [Synergistaceae bacterium]|nr:cytidylate kinase-like family protein [Synergistaceae bacterium]
MKNQILITIGREFGSAGHEIGECIAKKLGIGFYDRAMLYELASNLKIDEDIIEKYDERNRVPFLSRTVRNYSNSLEDMVFEFQKNYISEKADSGESFVLVGRCGELILKDRPGHISIFILGNKEEKIARIKEKYNLNTYDAYWEMVRSDRKRKIYHNSRCQGKWGDPRAYDMCINSSSFGVDNTVDLLVYYIKARLSNSQI